MKDIILSLGGSVIYPKGGIDTIFLKSFNKLVRKRVESGQRFLIVAGGGYLANQYKEVAPQIVSRVSKEDTDWLGVRATRLNAHLLRTIFHDIAAPTIVEHYNPIPRFGKEKVIIFAAEYPSSTTDWFLVILAQKLKVDTVYSLLNVKMIYEKDPKRYPLSKPVYEMSWREYRRMIGDEWYAGRQVPFDPYAARLAEQTKLTSIFLSGHDLDNFERALSGEKFVGTKIYDRSKTEDYE